MGLWGRWGVNVGEEAAKMRCPWAVSVAIALGGGCVYKVEVDTGGSCAAPSVGCDQDTANGVGADGDAVEATDGGAEAATVVDSCVFPGAGICFEYSDFPNTDAWCRIIGNELDAATMYVDAPCDPGSFATCYIAEPQPSDQIYAAVTVHYYLDFPGDPARECAAAGGDLSY